MTILLFGYPIQTLIWIIVQLWATSTSQREMGKTALQNAIPPVMKTHE